MANYIGKDNEIYASLEECVLACMLVEPKYIDTLIVEEKHFKKYGRVFVFLKKFYELNKCLDIALMHSYLESINYIQANDMMDMITRLLTIFVIPTNIERYEKALIKRYETNKKEEWLKKKIYEKATSLYLGGITLNEFNKDIDSLYKYAKKIEWK